MANLHFHYGTMNCGKSGRICDTAYSLRASNKQVEIIKPSFDNRDSASEVVSRNGKRIPALSLTSFQNYEPHPKTKVILVDEVQFFSPSDIDILVRIADKQKKIVMCYGLLVDSNEQMFPTSKRLLEVGAKPHQMTTTCQVNGCMKLATHHLRFDKPGRGRRVVRMGQQCVVGDDVYMSVCRAHFDRFYYGCAQKIRGEK